LADKNRGNLTLFVPAFYFMVRAMNEKTPTRQVATAPDADDIRDAKLADPRHPRPDA